jgi:hypothetical protein
MKPSKKRYAPGPGVDKGEPPKKGAERFFEIVGRDFFSLIRMSLLFCVAIFPSAAFFYLFMSGVFPYATLFLMLATAFPAGAALSASMYCIGAMLRDDLRWFWRDYKRKFRECSLQSAFPGIACVLFVYAQVYVYLMILVSVFFSNPEAMLLEEDIVYLWFVIVAQAIDPGWLVAGLSSILVLGMITPYIFMQLAYIDLGVVQILKNSALLAMSNFRRSILGSFISGLPWMVAIFFLPYSIMVLPFLMLFGFAFTWLIQGMWVWPVVDKQFSISETLDSDE